MGSGYEQYDPYQAHPPQEPSGYAQSGMPGAIAAAGGSRSPPVPVASSANSFYGAQPAPTRNYTLGGGGYGENTVPPLQDHQQYSSSVHSPPPAMGSAFMPGESHYTQSPPPIQTGVAAAMATAGQTSPVKGPRAQRGSQQYEDAPPGYDGPSNVTWTNEKR